MEIITRELLKAIKDIEWVWDDNLSCHCWQVCDGNVKDRHDENCSVGIAITNAGIALAENHFSRLINKS